MPAKVGGEGDEKVETSAKQALKYPKIAKLIYN